MKYYQAICEMYDHFNKNGVVVGELLTEKERNTKVPYISDYYFKIVEIPKYKTFKNFGVRFAIKE